MTLSLPDLGLVVLVGASGSGKSTFARRHFKPTEVVSSDACRATLADDELDQTVTPQAFELLHMIAGLRLALGRLTVVDATNVQRDARASLVALARKHHVFASAIVLDVPEVTCHERNALRPDRAFGPHVVRNQRQALRQSLRHLKAEGFRHVYVLRTPEEIEAVTVVRVPLWTDKRHLTGPFDVIGDVHGCGDELEELLATLGYAVVETSADPLWPGPVYAHPAGRTAVFVGDLVDRGPRNLDAVRLVRNMVARGSALAVPGNHDVKLVRKLRGKDVKVAHGLAVTLAEFDALPEESRPAVQTAVADFFDSLVSHYVLDGGRLVVAHAGMKAEYAGRSSGTVREFALYGETTGETDEFGLPVRLNWAAEYRGPAHVVYGHVPTPSLEWLNRTVCLDTGCVFGGALTALHWPEKEFVSVAAKRVYCEPTKPFLPTAADGLTAQQSHDRVLDAADVLGTRAVATRLRGRVSVRAENAAAAFEVMNRFAVDPRWLVYLPPTMSPCETSNEPGLLEHPAGAFAYYRAAGVGRVICEEKHMGSRAVVVVCRDEAAAVRRFGVDSGEIGVVTTRTGRPFFTDAALERAFLDRVRAALTASGLWEEWDTDWAVIDGELMPWSAKAQELLKGQYAAVGAAGTAATAAALKALDATAARLGEPAVALRDEVAARAERVGQFVAAYRHYCWPVASLDDWTFAPFHLMATEGAVHADKPHPWHLARLAAFCAADPVLFLATAHVEVDLADEASVVAAMSWWVALTEQGGEGMVVKPLDFVHRGTKGLSQPAVKCRGREYLRIIYGPDYTAETNLARLRRRGLGRKRALALGEFALGVEALERFVRGEPLRKVHECVFGVLALESEPVDPRL
jgi:protein phosphatase